MLTRRSVLRLASTFLAASNWPRWGWAGTPARVVIIGGGFGGAACAKYLRYLDPTLAVTIVTPQQRFVTCPFSNAVIAGLADISSIYYRYDVLRNRYGVQVVHARATEIDLTHHTVRLNTGRRLPYDRLVIAPGIEMQWNALEGYDVAASQIFPHAWEAGPQTLLLRQQLTAMPDGGLVIISVPENPYRCPPGPYERASLIAYYLKTYKPHAKVLVLDAKDSFTKHELFRAAWKRLYPQNLEWVSGSQGGRTTRVDVKAGTIHTDFDTYKPAVMNIIPPQRAAAIARTVGLDDGKGWCAIRPATFESTVHANVHIIGDAAIANPMPKSAFAANIQAKACAAAIVALLRDAPPPSPVLMNTCYSLVAPDYGISVAGMYRVVDQTIQVIPGTEGMSPLDASDETRALEADYARSWYANITADTFT